MTARRLTSLAVRVVLILLASAGFLMIGAQAAHSQTATDSARAARMKADQDAINAAAARIRLRAPTGDLRNMADSITRTTARTKARVDSSLKGGTPVPPVNQPPTVTLALAKVDSLRVTATATARDSDGTIVQYRWNWGDGTISTTVGPNSTRTFLNYGEKNVSVTVTDNGGAASSPAMGTITLIAPRPPPVDSGVPNRDSTVVIDSTLNVVLPMLPQATVSVTPRPCLRSVAVNIPENLQTKLDQSIPGDCLDLAPGEKWVGNFVLPAGTCTATTAWRVLRTRGVVDVPGVRMTPTAASTARLAQIVTNNNQPALQTSHPSCNWEILHVDVNVDAAFTGLNYWLFALGDGGWSGGGEKNTSRATQPYNIVVRRSYIHGQTTSNLIRCVVLNGISQAVVDSWISECHAKGFDSQAIEGWNGFGPFLIRNNFVSGAGENIMFGGADPAIVGLRPTDITIERNHVWKDPLWKGRGWTIKNLFELKNAKNVLVDGNVFENVWADAQVGMAIVWKSSQDACGTCTWQGTTDVTFTNNIVRYAHRGLNIQAVDGSGQAETNVHVARVRAENNLFHNIGVSNGVPATDGWLILLTHDVKDILIQNNTFAGNAPGYGLALYLAYHNGAMRNLRIRRNVLAGQSYYHIGAEGAPGVGERSLQYAAPNSWTFAENVVSAVEGQFQTPSGNTYLTTFAQVGLTATYTAPAFPGKGANITTLASKTAGVVVASPSTRARRSVPRLPAFKITPADIEYMSRQPKGTGSIPTRR